MPPPTGDLAGGRRGQQRRVGGRPNHPVVRGGPRPVGGDGSDIGRGGEQAPQGQQAGSRWRTGGLGGGWGRYRGVGANKQRVSRRPCSAEGAVGGPGGAR